ncbi:MAG: flagellar basal-body rod protein FlgG [Alphaproteobacteria bacterium]|nr:flagellar basal-body rod protein FlgG [Alphaproteobacteria bacterium]NCQ87588.1 flagellar basal-body rod protein FlgG [Alphaproteobacteria bacterium]NCT06457.1 flagellar basal-body rod protein FlgG [Alphaproteobacteria bacterium]
MVTRSLDIGATGMLAQQLNVDVISNNIANMTTSGYKRQRPEFHDLIYQNKLRPGATSTDANTTVPAGMQFGLGVGIGSVYRLHEQGTIQLTENSLDLAILGEGYFQIERPNGETAYTRAGVFQTNENGEIVTAQGYRLEPGFTVPEDAVDIIINVSGEVLAKLPQQSALQNLGQIELATFVNPAGLEAIGDTMFVETDASGDPQTGNPAEDHFGSIRQGTLENSNVNVVEEITNLIAAQRAYEMNSNVISTSDEMLQTVTQLR